MFDSVTIQNFRCLQQVKVPLKPLTVLIGQNDTGKTAFLDALYLMARLGGRHRPVATRAAKRHRAAGRWAPL